MSVSFESSSIIFPQKKARLEEKQQMKRLSLQCLYQYNILMFYIYEKLEYK